MKGAADDGASLTVRARALLRDARSRLAAAAPNDDVSWVGTGFTLLRRGDRNTVLRAEATARGTSAGEDAGRVVLKLSGEDPQLADADRRYMSALTGSGVVADVIAELADARGYAMVDAGDDTLTHRLERGARTQLLDSMRRVAQVYARLHVHGRALVDRGALQSSAPMSHEVERWMHALGRASSWLRLDEHDARLRQAVSCIRSVCQAQGNSITLTHGDPAPGNVLFLADGGARLVDFEYAAARPPEYDVTAWDVLCPLPDDVLQGFRDEYARARAALGWSVDVGSDVYAPVLAYRALALLSWLPHDARAQDRGWVDAWSARQAVLSTLDRLALRCVPHAELRPLAEAAADAARSWRREWPEIVGVLPPWPAFNRAG